MLPNIIDVPALMAHPVPTALSQASMPVKREYWASFRRLMEQDWRLVLF
jgi:hypothetical protein